MTERLDDMTAYLSKSMADIGEMWCCCWYTTITTWMSECVVISEGDNGNGVRFHRGTEFKISMCLSEPDLHKAASLDDMTDRLAATVPIKKHGIKPVVPALLSLPPGNPTLLTRGGRGATWTIKLQINTKKLIHKNS